MRIFRLLTGLALFLLAAPAVADTALDRLKSDYEKWRFDVYRTGVCDTQRLATLRAALDALALRRRGAARVAVDVEIGRNMRAADENREALALYARILARSEAVHAGDALFMANLGAARAHMDEGDVGAAAIAFDTASAIAGVRPTREHAYDLALYGAALARGRGELEAALVASLEATRFANGADDLNAAYLEEAETLVALATSCDERPFFDNAFVQGDP